MNIMLKLFGRTHEVMTVLTSYRNGGTALQLTTRGGEPYATVSVNLPASGLLPEGAFYVKHWSENEEIVEQLVAQEILIPVDAPATSSGFISDIKAYRLANNS